MVKISIKKDKKAIKAKPRQKQKQKQSQKVVVNIGSSYRPKRRTATGRALEKNKVVNKSTTAPTPNIYVPQSNPLYKQPESQVVLGELLKYLKETGVKEKNNELEKDKVKENKATISTDEEIAQVQFTTINGQNISALTSGTATPNPLSYPVDHNSLYDSLMRVADLRGENPNSGKVSFSTLESYPLTFTTISTNNSTRSNPLSSILTSTDTSIDSYPTQFIRSDGVDTRFESTRETAPMAPSKTTQAIADRESDGSSVLSSSSTAPSIDDLLSNTQAPPMPVEEQGIELEEEAEPEAPIEPLIIEPPQPELVVFNPPQAEAPLLYENEDQTTPPKKEEPRQAEEPTPIKKLPDIISFEEVIDKFGLKQLGEILIKNNINSEDGYPFFIKDGHVKTTRFNTDTARLKYFQIDKPELKQYLIDAHEKGLINI